MVFKRERISGMMDMKEVIVFLRSKLKFKIAKFLTKSNRNLLVELIRAGFKDSDYHSVLGFFWSFLNPCVLLFVMFFVFKSRFGHGIEAYPLYILLGVVFVGFMTTATNYAGRVFLINRDFVLNSPAFRENLIISVLAIHVYKFLIELICCGIVSALYGFFSWKSMLLFLPLFSAYIAFILGITMTLSILYCFARDIEHIWALLSRVFLFITPIFYALHQVSPFARKMIYFMNPITPFLISTRQLFIGGEAFNWLVYAHSLLLGGSFFIAGYSIFIVFENIALERA